MCYVNDAMADAEHIRKSLRDFELVVRTCPEVAADSPVVGKIDPVAHNVFEAGADVIEHLESWDCEVLGT